MRCGVFLCECGGNISGVLDLDSLADATRGSDGVVSISRNQFMCGSEGRRLIEQAVEERGLDRIVIGACSRRFQGPTFERIARELRLGENAVAFANLREGCSFIHRDEPVKAQRKAEKIVAAAVARAGFQADLPRGRTFLHRSALVVGGGIAGITAAEELAGAGIDVHLVEREQSLGGYMARLSKTFPTEDCAMCSLAPQLTGVALEPRVHIRTLTDVTEISGPPGEFRVKLRQRPRFVSEACVACDDCTPACPVSVSSEFELGVAKRKAISRPFANAVPSLYAIDKRGSSPCKTACPAGTSAQGYVALVAEGRFDEAYRVASEPNPFPSVCGRICTHPCESACVRGEIDEPVAIAALKRFVADRVGPETVVEKAPLVHSEKVAIVGAGPAGLTCARDLAKLGYQTTVFEALPVAGGMLKTGIPDYRLPKDVLRREIGQIAALGVEIETGKRYTESDFNKIIEIKEREAHRVKVFMDQIDQREKTLVFCATQDHALAVRDLINQMKTSTDPNYCQRVTADDGALGRQMVTWRHTVEQQWAALRFGAVKVETDGTRHAFEVQLSVHDLDPEAVRVELYADGINGDRPVRQEMTHVRRLEGADGRCVYIAQVPATRPATDYTARVIPHHDGVAIPLEAARILWQR